jgi:anti-sigma regulatory factor (Ser/Thr protein kinase)
VAEETAAGLIPLGPLQTLGHNVRAVEDAGAALDLARACPPSLVLIGPALREGCPAQLCRDLKLSPDTNPLPVVRVVPLVEEAPALEIEPDATLSRPGQKAELAAAICRALSSRAEAICEGAITDLRWRVPSGPDALDAFQAEFAQWLAGCGLSPYQMQRVELAVRELTANAIEWGHGYQRDRIVSVAARLDDEKVSVLVRDTGPGFNPRDLPHAARHGDPITHLQVRAEKQLREGGFGILMASGLVDHLAYNEAGNEALAIKFLRHRREALAS